MAFGQKSNSFAKKPAAAGKKKYDQPAFFMNPEQGQYGPMYVGEYNGVKATLAETKDGGKFKFTFTDANGSPAFSIGKVKENNYGAFIPFSIDGTWWYATTKTNAKGNYVLVKSTGRAVEPREYVEAELLQAPEIADVDANGHPIDEGTTEIPEEAFKAAAAKPAVKPAIGKPAAKPAFGAKAAAAAPASAGKPKRAQPKNLDDIPF